MREIKFRAWDKRRQQFHWGISNVCLTLGGNLMWQFGFKSPDFLDKEEAEDYVLQQYTGLHDKNGEEIYEGDIIRDNEKKNHKVLWDSSLYGWSPFGCHIPWSVGSLPKHFEVIGNIYENPELVEEE